MLFGVLGRRTLAGLLCGPNHRLDANLHIGFGGRKIRYVGIAVRPDAQPCHTSTRPYGAGFSGCPSERHQRCDRVAVAVPPGRRFRRGDGDESAAAPVAHRGEFAPVYWSSGWMLAVSSVTVRVPLVGLAASVKLGCVCAPFFVVATAR